MNDVATIYAVSITVGLLAVFAFVLASVEREHQKQLVIFQISALTHAARILSSMPEDQVTRSSAVMILLELASNLATKSQKVGS